MKYESAGAASVQKGELMEEVKRAGTLLKKVTKAMGQRIVGQDDMITGILMGIMAQGHVLLEGVPGLAKTMTVKTLADITDTVFKRIQFTPDLLPADLVGTMIYRPQTGEFVPRYGPIFGNIILADEINRAPAKVQSALLEAMEERQVTIGGTTYPLQDPFFVIATQNPIEQEGTYPLPEAQLDRFMLKLFVDYPSMEEEKEILHRVGVSHAITVKQVLKQKDIRRLQQVVERITVEDAVKDYIVRLVNATRSGEDSEVMEVLRYIEFGASPRATIFMYRCAKVQAVLNERSYVTPDDVKAVANDILRHRITLSYEADSEERSSESIIDALLAKVSVP